MVVCIRCERDVCEGVDDCLAFLATERRRLITFEPLAKLGLNPVTFQYVLKIIFEEHDATSTAKERLDNTLADWVNAAQSDFRFGRLASEPTPRRLREAIAVAVEQMGRLAKAESRAALLEEGLTQLLAYCTEQIEVAEGRNDLSKVDALQTVSLVILRLRREPEAPRFLLGLHGVALAVRAHAGAWEPTMRLLGDVRAGELVALAQFVLLNEGKLEAIERLKSRANELRDYLIQVAGVGGSLILNYEEALTALDASG